VTELRLTALVEAEPRRWGLPLNIAMSCSGCGEVYGRLIFRIGARWQFRYGCCPTCPPAGDYTIPGSIWQAEDTINAAFPDAVLREEFERHLKWYDQQMEKYECPTT